MCVLCSVLGLAVLEASASAQTTIGGTVNLSGSSPSFTRPSGGPTMCYAGAASVKYTTVEFYGDTTGNYTFETTGNGAGGHVSDPYLLIYTSPFDPTMQLHNCVAGDDDSGNSSGGALESLLTLSLTANTIYTAIITTYGAGATGLIGWSGHGVGNMYYVNSIQSAVASAPSDTGGTLTVQVSNPDDAYWVAVPSASPAPSRTQVVAGQDSTGTAAPSGHFTVAAAGTDTATTLTGLSGGTAYTIYVVAYNAGFGSGVRNSTLTTTTPPGPTLVSSVPADGATDVAPGSQIALTFSAAFSLDSGNIAIVNDTDVSTETIDVANHGGKLSLDVSNTVLTIAPGTALALGKSYHVTIDGTAILGMASGHYAGIGDATTLNFSTIPLDISPDDYSFDSQRGVPPSSARTSNTITVAGLNTGAEISITGGTYAINAGTPTAAAGTVVNGDTVTLHQTSSPDLTTTTTATVTIGTVSRDFEVTTGENNPFISSSSFSDEQGSCTTGGVKIDIGVDYDANSMLAEDEVTHTDYVCNGGAGVEGAAGAALITTTTLEPDADVCPNGGIEFSVGTDDNHNDALDDGEVTGTRHICQNTDTVFKTVMLDAKSSDCPYGGLKLTSGADADGDGSLDDAEVTSTETICNGIGLALRTSKLAAGSMDCPNGGVRLQAGPDSNGDLTLDDAEVTASEVLCDAVGVLFDTTTLASDPNVCEHGGLRIKIGRDNGDPSGTAGDGVLQDAEVDVTRDVCLASTDVLVGGGKSSCSVVNVGGAGSSAALLWAGLPLIGALLRRRRARQERAQAQ